MGPPLRSRCSKFQPVAQFDASKRSCAASLASHNARRRRDEAQGSRKSPPSGPSPTREVAREDTASALHGHVGEDDGSAVPRLGGVGCPALEAFINGGVLDIADWLSAQYAYSAGPSPADSAQQPSAASAAAEAAAVDAYTVHLKLGNAHSVEDVPVDSLLPELELLLPGLGPMCVASRYGCVLLSFDGLAPAAAALGARTASPHVVADALARVLRARKLGALVPGSSVLLFSDARPSPAGAPLLVTADDAAAAAAAGHPPAAWLPLAAGWLGRVPAPLQGLVPGAVLLQPTPDGGATVTLELGTLLGVASEGDGGVEVATSVHARAQGLTLAQEPLGRSSAQLRVTLPAGLAGQGCFTLLLEAQEERRWPGGGAPSTSLSRSLAILACQDAEVAAQVAATCAPLARAGGGAAARRERASMDAVLRACGDAFCPDAPLAVAVAAAKACLVLGWDALLLALLQAQHLSPVSRGALVLACMAHMRRSRPVSGPCASVVHACALQLWPDSAPAAAASLLVASEREGISIPELATEAALLAATAQRDDGGAAQVLRALQLLLQQGQSSPWHHAHVAATAGRGEVEEALQLGPATEREAFNAMCAAANVPTARIYLLFVLSLDVIGYVRRLALRRASLPILPSELVTLTRVMTTEETMRAHFYHDAWTFMPNTLALLLLLLPPAASRARRFYIRNATALFTVHCVTTYLLNHMLFELYVRRWLAVPAAAALLPRWWSIGQLNITASAATAPMPAAPLCVLLALRAALMFAPAAWSLWPTGQPLLGGNSWWALSQARANAVLTLLLCVRLLRNERRHFASWRYARAVRAAKDA